MDWDCWHSICRCYCCCCCRLCHSDIWTSSSSSSSFLSFLDYPTNWPTSVMYSYVRLWLIVNRKKKTSKREEKIWFAVLISYKENISTHSGCISFSRFLWYKKRNKKKADLFSLRFVLFLRHKLPPTLKIFLYQGYTASCT